MDFPQGQLEKAKRAIEFLVGLALDQGESSNSLASDRITSPSTSLQAASSVTDAKIKKVSQIITVIKCMANLPYPRISH